MTPYNQYAATLRKFETKAQQLGTLPLTDKEKVAALNTWAYPVFDVVGKLVYPVQQVRTRVDSIARQSLRMANWSMTDAINMQPEDKGGIGVVLPSQYLYHSCKGMLEGWGAERQRLRMQAQEQQAGIH